MLRPVLFPSDTNSVDRLGKSSVSSSSVNLFAFCLCQPCQCPLPRCFRTIEIDLISGFGCFSKHCDSVSEHFDEPTRCRPESFAAFRIEHHCADSEPGHKGNMPGQHSKVTALAGNSNVLHVKVSAPPLWRHDAHRQEATLRTVISLSWLVSHSSCSLRSVRAPARSSLPYRTYLPGCGRVPRWRSS